MNTDTQVFINHLYHHDLATYRHSLRVGDNLYGFSNYLGMDNSEKIYLLGCLHDIGKLRIPAALLNKKGKLIEHEFDKIKNHTVYSAQYLSEIKELPPEYAEAALFHHENIDASGYFALKGNDIPILSRMIRIIDTYDTMLYGRIYQNPVCQKDVIQELTSLSDKHYDTDLVQSFIKYLEQKFGSNMQYGT